MEEPPPLDELMRSPLGDDSAPEPPFRREYQPWQRTLFLAKLLLLPPLFIASAIAVVYGAIWISFSPPLQKLWGVLMLVGAVVGMTVGLWIALDRPKQWFAPGVNDEPVPGRRLPRWFRRRRLRG
jgi:hypothetical protein